MLTHLFRQKSPLETHLMGPVSLESAAASRGLEVTGNKMTGDGRVGQHDWSISLERPHDSWPVFICFAQLLTPSQPLTSTLFLPGGQPVL